MPNSSDLDPTTLEVGGWRLAMGAVLVAALVASAVYDTNFLGAADLVAPAGSAASSSPGTDEPVPRFLDITAEAGLAGYTRTGWDLATTRYAAIIGAGAGVADVDGDGFDDIVLTGSEGEGQRLFLHQPDHTYLDATAAWGLAPPPGQAPQLCNGVAFGDLDADGDPDLALGCLGTLAVYRNLGDRFEEQALALGLDLDGRCGAEPCLPSSLGWFDLENDGDLDLYVVNHVDALGGKSLGPQQVFPYLTRAPAQPAMLFRNDGAAGFTEVAEQAGVANHGGKGLGMLVTDLDRDGFADLYVANDLTPNRLFRNQHDGTFRDIARDLGVDEWKSSMGVAAGDVDRDGTLELAVTNVLAQAISLFQQGGDGRYAYRTHDLGLGATQEGTGWGVVFFDPDLDGDLDLAHAVGIFFDTRVTDFRNQFFLNTGVGSGRFVDATDAAGLGDTAVSRAMLAFDADRDGDEDLLVANTLGRAPQLLRNDGPHLGASVQLRLRGTSAHPDAVGAQVQVTWADGASLTRDVTSACSYASSCPLRLTFGLGEAATQAGQGLEVTVRWPGPTGVVEESFGVIGAGSHLLVQGTGTAEPDDPPGRAATP